MGETRELRDDAEITLGTGKLLGIFFGLAVICAVFFTMGYMLGRGSAAGAKTEIVNSAPNSGTANKPSAGNNTGNKSPGASAQPCVAGSANCSPTGSGPDSTFYNSVSNKPANGEPQPAGGASAQPTASSSSTASATTPEPKNVSTGSFIVQVAAVSKQEDAEILVAALRKKQYPVFLSSGGGDALFRVQVGPYTDAKEAESMRARLAGEGYNPIVKK